MLPSSTLLLQELKHHYLEGEADTKRWKEWGVRIYFEFLLFFHMDL